MRASLWGIVVLPLMVGFGSPDARSVTIEGRVTDAATGGALSGVQVSVEGTLRGTMTSDAGTYRLVLENEMRGRTVRIMARRLGYEPQRVNVALAGDLVRADIALRASAIQLHAIEITQSDGRGQPSTLGAVMAPAYRAERGAVAGVIGTRPADPDWNTEAYDAISENPFLAVGSNPLSTFSIDVDRAAYSNVRRFIGQGQAPPKDAVRIEEMINYFSYDAPKPSGRDPFAVVTEVGAAPWRPEHHLVRIALHAPRIATSQLPPSNLVFLIDVSGSMRGPTRLDLVKQSLRLLVDQLREQDRVAIVVYSGAAGLVLESTPGSDKERILDAINALEAGGSTAGGAGLRLAYEVARTHHLRGGNNRVILATDGDFNVGVSSDGEMVRLVEERRKQGTFLTVLGYGMGNYKDAKLEKLSNAGNGNFAYIDDLMEAKKVLVSEFGGTLFTVAKDVKIQVEFNPARVAAYRLIGYENRLLRSEDFADDTKDAGELGAGHSVTALYEVIPVGSPTAGEVRVAGDLRYQETRPRTGAARSGELLHVRVRYKQPDGDVSALLERAVAGRATRASEDFTFAASVAAFGMILRDSEHKGKASLHDVLAMAGRSRGEDREGYRAEFIRMVERYARMEVAAR
ncbi:MAG TPA: von Willebrand factor type A domain-containing protein [Gemmatimonadaceae bacterium]|nr:von Willebrand factor type A domain-containing protein [Gemmatimonadaceae bacterium]